jgi:hypothetical protein
MKKKTFSKVNHSIETPALKNEIKNISSGAEVPVGAFEKMLCGFCD